MVTDMVRRHCPMCPSPALTRLIIALSPPTDVGGQDLCMRERGRQWGSLDKMSRRSLSTQLSFKSDALPAWALGRPVPRTVGPVRVLPSQGRTGCGAGASLAAVAGEDGGRLGSTWDMRLFRRPMTARPGAERRVAPGPSLVGDADVRAAALSADGSDPSGCRRDHARRRRCRRAPRAASLPTPLRRR